MSLLKTITNIALATVAKDANSVHRLFNRNTTKEKPNTEIKTEPTTTDTVEPVKKYKVKKFE